MDNFWNGFTKQAWGMRDITQDETREVLEHHAQKSKKTNMGWKTLGSAALGSLAGAGIGALADGREGAIGGALTGLFGGTMGGLLYRGRQHGHNRSIDKAREIGIMAEGPEKEKAIAKANPNRLFSHLRKQDVMDMKKQKQYGEI